MSEYNDYPFDEVCANAEKHMAQGAEVYQKFTCESCGQRLTMDEPNVFYLAGDCDRCGHITDIKARGCNFLMMTKGIR